MKTHIILVFMKKERSSANFKSFSNINKVYFASNKTAIVKTILTRFPA